MINIKNQILSEGYIQRISASGQWVNSHHMGSTVLDYFLDHGYEIEYGDSRKRKAIIKAYLETKVEQVINDLKSIEQQVIYRSIYVKDYPVSMRANFGLFWSTDEMTSACVQKPSEDHLELLLSTKINKGSIDWFETIVSRLDPLFGDRESEIQLAKDTVVTLEEIIIL